MRKYGDELKTHQVRTNSSEFLRSYNENMPVGFPRASMELLKRFREANPMLFKNGDFWSLDQHRKKLIDWLPRNS